MCGFITHSVFVQQLVFVEQSVFNKKNLGTVVGTRHSGSPRRTLYSLLLSPPAWTRSGLRRMKVLCANQKGPGDNPRTSSAAMGHARKA